MKKRSALRALDLIEDEMIVGLGGGSTIAHLINYIKEENKQVKIVTPSFTTANLCLEAGITVLPTYLVSHINIAFDGCDEVDKSLNALKSGGGIHTQEKIIASLANDYVLLVDESKYFEKLPFNVPVVLEVVPEARLYVMEKMRELGASIVERKSSAKDGVTRSDNGNLILDAQFEMQEDLETLNRKLQQTVGVVETSLFYHVATKMIVATETTTELIERTA